MSRLVIVMLSVIFVYGCTSASNKGATEDKEQVSDSLDVVVDTLSEADLNTEKQEGVSYVPHEAQGVLLASNHIIYNEALEPVDTFENDSAIVLPILRKTSLEQGQGDEEDICNWASYVEVLHDSDTVIVYGKEVMEFLQTDSVSWDDTTTLLLSFVKDFSVGPFFNDDLSYCGEVHYLLIQSLDGEMSYVLPDSSYTDTKEGNAYLMSNDGMSEKATGFHVDADTLYVHINVGYQTEQGEYDMKIFRKNDQWRYNTGNVKIIESY